MIAIVRSLLPALPPCAGNDPAAAPGFAALLDGAAAPSPVAIAPATAPPSPETGWEDMVRGLLPADTGGAAAACRTPTAGASNTLEAPAGPPASMPSVIGQPPVAADAPALVKVTPAVAQVDPRALPPSNLTPDVKKGVVTVAAPPHPCELKQEPGANQALEAASAPRAKAVAPPGHETTSGDHHVDRAAPVVAGEARPYPRPAIANPHMPVGLMLTAAPGRDETRPAGGQVEPSDGPATVTTAAPDHAAPPPAIEAAPASREMVGPDAHPASRIVAEAEAHAPVAPRLDVEAAPSAPVARANGTLPPPPVTGTEPAPREMVTDEAPPAGQRPALEVKTQTTGETAPRPDAGAGISPIVAPAPATPQPPIASPAPPATPASSGPTLKIPRELRIARDPLPRHAGERDATPASPPPAPVDVSVAPVIDIPTVRPSADAAPAGTASAPPTEHRILTHLLGAEHDAASLDRLARDITASAGDGPLRFGLEPDALGPVGVEIRRGEDGTAIRLSTASHAAHAAMTEARPQLLAEAQAQGVRVSHAAITLTSGQGGGAGGGQPDAQRRPPPPPAARIDRADEPAGPPGPQDGGRYA